MAAMAASGVGAAKFTSMAARPRSASARTSAMISGEQHALAGS
jgi:hypothetical protein